jgi:hypothetical protein
VTPLLGIYPKECKSGYDRATCMPMFITALLTIAKPWKQPRCPKTDEYIKKMWHIYTMKYYIKKNEIILFAGKWIDLETLVLSEVSQVQTHKGHILPHMQKVDL